MGSGVRLLGATRSGRSHPDRQPPTRGAGERGARHVVTLLLGQPCGSCNHMHSLGTCPQSHSALPYSTLGSGGRGIARDPAVLISRP
jgi:hypothetical protein